MKTITLRNVDESLERALDEAATHAANSVNGVILDVLRESFGLKKKPRKQHHHDLDKLAGTWSQKDLQEFADATKPFDRIDKDMWS